MSDASRSTGGQTERRALTSTREPLHSALEQSSLQPLALNNVMAGPDDMHGPVRFEEIEHTADRALRIHGTTWEAFLVNAARGLNSILAAAKRRAPERKSKEVALEAIDAESLLVAWLSELAYWAEAEALVFDEFVFHELKATRVSSTVTGAVAGKLDRHVKAVTFHDLAIVRDAAGFSATVVFDV
jgi:SHS2 domain-containing protein